MTGLAATLANIARYRRALTGDFPAGHDRGHLVEVGAFGANPGNLRMLTYLPPDLPLQAPLVVVLHGCGQSAAGYEAGAGWSTLADRYGFALLLPEQARANNQAGCFNWFQPEDIRRGHGEAASIRTMILHIQAAHGLDPARCFVTGLSAGGAFANVMLAAYPELFAAGAIIAGLPYGAAGSMQAALEQMYGGRARSGPDWGDLVRHASGHRGAWPRVQVWHGGADATVVPGNGVETVKQWLDVHGIDAPARRERIGVAEHLVWRVDGRAVVESVRVPGLGHGTPIDARDCGRAGPFLLEAGISSSTLIAESWGLTGVRRDSGAVRAKPPEEGVIHKALRAAGLMRD